MSSCALEGEGRWVEPAVPINAKMFKQLSVELIRSHRFINSVACMTVIRFGSKFIFRL